MKPDFFLSAMEGHGLRNPRRCWQTRRVKVGDNPGCLAVRIDPPVIGPWYGPGVSEVILAPRFVGDTLVPIVSWPVHVHVARILSPPRRSPSEGHVQETRNR